VPKGKPPRPGDYVSNDEIASYHLPGHAGCWKGWIKGVELCDCARERFLGEHMFRIWPDAERDALRWGPNPPTHEEMREVARRSGTAWAEFIKDAQPNERQKLLKDIEDQQAKEKKS
jgi:hypothetical protein